MRRMAPYWQTVMHLPHLMHFSGSICPWPRLKEIASFGQTCEHGLARQPWHWSVMTTLLSGQA